MQMWCRFSSSTVGKSFSNEVYCACLLWHPPRHNLERDNDESTRNAKTFVCFRAEQLFILVLVIWGSQNRARVRK